MNVQVKLARAREVSVGQSVAYPPRGGDVQLYRVEVADERGIVARCADASRREFLIAAPDVALGLVVPPHNWAGSTSTGGTSSTNTNWSF